MNFFVTIRPTDSGLQFCAPGMVASSVIKLEKRGETVNQQKRSLKVAFREVSAALPRDFSPPSAHFTSTFSRNVASKTTSTFHLFLCCRHFALPPFYLGWLSKVR